MPGGSPSRSYEVTSATAALPANPTFETPLAANYVPLLQVSAGGVRQRCVQARSDDGNPFDLRIEWTAGGGAGGAIILTAVGGAIRFYVQAAALNISAASWSPVLPGGQIVRCSVTDEDGKNEYLYRVARFDAIAAFGVSPAMPLPSFARDVQVAVSTPALLAATAIEHTDSAEAPASQLAAAYPTPCLPTPNIRVRNNNAVVLPAAYLAFRLGV